MRSRIADSRLNLLIVGLLFLALYVALLGLSPRPMNPAIPNRPEVVAAPLVQTKGILAPRSWVELSSARPARVEQVYGFEGEQVAAGAILLRLEGYEDQAALAATANLELTLANQALETLLENAKVAYAANQAALERARRELELAEDLHAGLQRPKSAWQIEQARSNLMLAEYHLEQAREDFQKAQQRYRNKKHIIWSFINERKFKLSLTAQEKALAYEERRYLDALETYEELLRPVDPVDMALAEARENYWQSRVDWLENEGKKLADGPDPDALELAQMSITLARSRLAEAEAEMSRFELAAPFDSEVVAVEIKAGEFAFPGQPLVVLADLTDWVVEADRIEEFQVQDFIVGEAVTLTFDAFPDAPRRGIVENVSAFYEEEDERVYYHARLGVDSLPDGALWGMTVRIGSDALP